MRRCLVLTSEAARHAFRASLPANALSVEGIPFVLPARVRRRGLTQEDVRDFLLSYCACLCAVGAFLI